MHQALPKLSARSKIQSHVPPEGPSQQARSSNWTLAESPTSRGSEPPNQSQHYSIYSIRRKSFCRSKIIHPMMEDPHQNHVIMYQVIMYQIMYSTRCRNYQSVKSLCRSNMRKHLPPEGPSQSAQTSIGNSAESPTSSGSEPTIPIRNQSAKS